MRYLFPVLAILVGGCQSAPAPKPTLPHFWITQVSTKSYSMWGPEKGVARIAVHSYPFELLKVGDIVCFQVSWQEGFIVHAIWEKQGSLITTKGYRNAETDSGYLTERNYLGKVELLGFVPLLKL